MNPNPFLGLLHSRKFWLAVIDAFAAVLALWVGSYVETKLAQLIMATWAAFQPVLIVVITAIAYEDKAKLEAASADRSTEAYIARSASKPDPSDDHAAELTEAFEAGAASTSG